MSLLPTKKYTRPQPQQEQQELKAHCNANVIDVLANEEMKLLKELEAIAEAKKREPNLTNRLNVVQNSLQSFYALEAAPPPVQEQQVECQEKRIRKAATKKTDKPTARSIAPKPTVSDTENIELVHDDFATFPE
jgi:hypothetical protein